MIYDILSGFFIMVLGIAVINAGIWVKYKINKQEYDKDTQKEILIFTCIGFGIWYIINIIDLLRK